MRFMVIVKASQDSEAGPQCGGSRPNNGHGSSPLVALPSLGLLKASRVRVGSKADIGARLRDVRFTPKRGHAQRGH